MNTVYFRKCFRYVCLVLLLVIMSNAGNTQKKVVRPIASKTILLRILTYNIHHANPPSLDDSIDINAVAKVIEQQKPDLVALQEIDAHTARSGKDLHEAEYLAAKAGMKVFFAKAIDFKGGEYGIAILSKFPISNAKRFPLPTIEGTHGEPRVLATTEVTLPGNKKIVFACTHLDAEDVDTNRIVQMRAVLDVLKNERLPVILCGDFNAIPESKTIHILDAYFTRSCLSNCAFTIPSDKPTETIDYITFAPKNKFIVKQHTVVNEKYASDHLPVLAIIEIK